MSLLARGAGLELGRWPVLSSEMYLYAGAGDGQAFVGAFDDELADELGQSGEDAEDRSASRGDIHAVTLHEGIVMLHYNGCHALADAQPSPAQGRALSAALQAVTAASSG
ncbi:hypothetical protein [Nonomuraea bangladeshensis]|uniref:hypothetical protein n=1 Tax=Nonomuraea bangladeshensis TaxID=404385 RepID=UPI003C2C6BEB